MPVSEDVAQEPSRLQLTPFRPTDSAGHMIYNKSMRLDCFVFSCFGKNPELHRDP